MKKTIKIFAMMAIAASMAFVGCSKDDEDSAAKAESLVITFGGEEVPMGWFDALFDGEFMEIEAAAAYNGKGYRAEVQLPYLDMSFTENYIYDGFYTEHANRMYNGLCEWRYDEDSDQDFQLSGFDATALTIQSAVAWMTMYDYWGDNNPQEDMLDDQILRAVATNISFDRTPDAKAAKKNYVFHN